MSANPCEIRNIEADRRVLELLAQTFPNVSAASSEIMNLEAILSLPKGTEHFVADLHGEYEAFHHILRNASGNIRRKVTEAFGNALRESEIRRLCSLIYYPERKLELIKSEESSLADFYRVTLNQLTTVCRSVSSKYTRSKVRKTLPQEYAYIIEELLHEAPSGENKQPYYNRVIETIISTGQAEPFICALCNVIQRLSIDQLHILGDIFDRGQGAHVILDTLSKYKDFDIQWGNHDALWMGAAAGNPCCVANVLRVSLRYDNMNTLEDGYGINLVPLATFAMETYGDDPCEAFMPKVAQDNALSEKSRRMIAKMHKSISVIQFKLEGQMYDKYPEWRMQKRKLLDKIDYEKRTVMVEGVEYDLLDTHFPTIDPGDPYRLTPEEEELIEKLVHSFCISDKLKRHIHILLSHGGMYTVSNSNLLYHASVPLNEDGSMREVEVEGHPYSGRELLQRVEMLMRSAFNTDTPREDRQYAIDYFLYIWSGPDSPLFDKAKMTTFERYLILDKTSHTEKKGWYYKLRDSEEVCGRILDEFGVKGSHRHIINGHVPVKASAGESPVKANGMLMVIDGGFSKAYHNTTGIAGYTLIFHSSGFELVQHDPFTSAEEAVRNGTDIVSTTALLELNSQRLRVRDTDKGKELQAQIDELTELLYAYRHGIIKERK